MATRPVTAHVHARPQTDRTCLLVWRLATVAGAIILAMGMHNVEGGGAWFFIGERVPELADFIGEWFARL
jgi:hypothetical protein